MQPRTQAPPAVQPQQQRKPDPLVDALAAHLQSLYDLGMKISTTVNDVTHATTPHMLNLNEDLKGYLLAWKACVSEAEKLHPVLIQKLQSMQLKGPTQSSEPILARRLLQVIVLHLVSEQSMVRRLEELNGMERKKKEYIVYLESGVKTLYENLEEVANRLNLLVYMQSSLEREGVLPANIMYNNRIPKVIVSPFGAVKMQAFIPKKEEAPVQKAAPMPVPAHKVTPDREKMKKDLEKQRELLIKLREQERAVKNKI